MSVLNPTNLTKMELRPVWQNSMSTRFWCSVFLWWSLEKDSLVQQWTTTFSHNSPGRGLGGCDKICAPQESIPVGCVPPALYRTETPPIWTETPPTETPWKEHRTRERDPPKEHGTRQPDRKWHHTETPPPPLNVQFWSVWMGLTHVSICLSHSV